MKIQPSYSTYKSFTKSNSAEILFYWGKRSHTTHKKPSKTIAYPSTGGLLQLLVTITPA